MRLRLAPLTRPALLLALAFMASDPAIGGLPTMSTHSEASVEGGESCVGGEPPTQVPGMPSVSGASGSVEFALDVPGAQGGPGSPVNLSFIYSSGGDDPGTYGTNVNVSVKYMDLTQPHVRGGVVVPGDPTWAIVSWPSASIRFNPVTDETAITKVGFGASWQERSSGRGVACNPIRDTPANPPSWPVEAPPLSNAPEDARCIDVSAYVQEAQWREVTFSFPIRVGATPQYDTVANAALCTSAQTSFPDADLAMMRHEQTFKLAAAHPPHGDEGDDCRFRAEKPIYVAKRADPEIARLGVNWTHNYAWKLTRHRRNSVGARFVVHVPGGGEIFFSDPNNIPPRLSQYEIPRVNGCSCSGVRLFRSYRHGGVFGSGDGTPGNPEIAEDTYELLQKDGTRLVFHGAFPMPFQEPGQNPELAGHLGRIEDLHGLNATELTYNVTVNAEPEPPTIDLASIKDAAGNLTNFSYSGEGAARRLDEVTCPTLPASLRAKLTWSGSATDPNRRLIAWRDPVQCANPALAPWTFTYDVAAPSGFGANDIKTKTSPDGQVVEYTYYPLPGDGAPDGRAGNVLWADRKAGGVILERLQYLYPSRHPSTASEEQGSWVIVEHVDPITGEESPTSPRMRYDFMADGRLARTTATCGEDDACPSIVLAASQPVPERISEVIEEINYDANNLPWVWKRWARGTNPLITNWESYFSKTCVMRDAGGNVVAALGPTCVNGDGTPVEADWGTCDCEAWILSEGMVGPRPVGPLFGWESVATPDDPSILPGGNYYRPTSVTPASEAEYLDNPLAEGKSWRIYYCDAPAHRMSDRQVQAICPPEHPDPPYNLGGPACEVLADAGCETFQWDGYSETSNWLAAHFDGLHGKTTFEREGDRQLLTSVKDPSDRVTSLTYGALLNDPTLVSTTAPGNRVTSFDWNARGQLTRQVAPGGIGTGFGYSSQGRLRLVSDLNRTPHAEPASDDRVSWWFTRDPARGLPTHVARGKALFDFTGGGVLPLTASPLLDDASARIYEGREFDAEGRVTAIQPPLAPGETGSIRTSYDGFGNPWKREIDRGGGLPPRVECHAVDPRIGALVALRFSLDIPGDDVDPTCDPGSHGLVSASETAEIFARDVAGRLVSETFQWKSGAGADRHVICHEHDAYGRLTSTHSRVVLQAPPTDCGPDGPMSQDEFFEWNANGQMTAMTTRHDGVETAQFVFEYDDAQRLIAREEMISGLRLDYFFEPDGTLTEIWRRDMNAAPPTQPGPWRVYEFTHDDAGRLTDVLDRPEPPWPVTDRAFTTYAYDNAARLVRGTHQRYGHPATYDVAYTYGASDPWNIAAIDDLLAPPTTLFEHDDDDQIVTPAGWSYDARGNVTADPSRSAMTWTLDGRLSSVTKGGVTTRHRYDPTNRLLTRRADSSPPVSPRTFHLWNGWEQVGEYEVADPQLGQPGRTLSLVSGPTGLLGQRVESGGFGVLGHDHQGSTTGGVDTIAIHEPFGDLAAGAMPSKLAFQGQEWRAESGLHYMRHRWYASDVGRFLSRDRVITSGVNNYEFANASPTQFADPSGDVVRLARSGNAEQDRRLAGALVRDLRVPAFRAVFDPLNKAADREFTLSVGGGSGPRPGERDFLGGGTTPLRWIAPAAICDVYTLSQAALVVNVYALDEARRQWYRQTGRPPGNDGETVDTAVAHEMFHAYTGMEYGSDAFRDPTLHQRVYDFGHTIGFSPLVRPGLSPAEKLLVDALLSGEVLP